MCVLQITASVELLIIYLLAKPTFLISVATNKITAYKLNQYDTIYIIYIIMHCA